MHLFRARRCIQIIFLLLLNHALCAIAFHFSCFLSSALMLRRATPISQAFTRDPNLRTQMLQITCIILKVTRHLKLQRLSPNDSGVSAMLRNMRVLAPSPPKLRGKVEQCVVASELIA